MTTDLEALTRRLDDMERANRRLRWGGGGLAAVMLVALVPTSAFLVMDRLMPREFAVTGLRLLDASGTTRATLGVEKDGRAVLGVNDAQEKKRAMLGVSSDGAPTLHLVDRQASATLTISTDMPALLLTDANGKPRVVLAVFAKQKGGGLVLNDANGTERASLTLNEDTPVLAFADTTSAPRVALGVSADNGAPVFHFFDETGKDRASLNINGLFFADANNRQRVTLLAEEMLGKGPKFVLRDADGNTVWRAP